MLSLHNGEQSSLIDVLGDTGGTDKRSSSGIECGTQRFVDAVGKSDILLQAGLFFGVDAYVLLCVLAFFSMPKCSHAYPACILHVPMRVCAFGLLVFLSSEPAAWYGRSKIRRLLGCCLKTSLERLWPLV